MLFNVNHSFADDTVRIGDAPKGFYVSSNEGYPVCDVIVKNLNSIPNLTLRLKELPAPPNSSTYRKPDWQNVDVRAHKDIVAHLDVYDSLDDTKRFGPDRGSQKHFEELSPQFDAFLERDITEREAIMQVAQFDIDNDKVPDTVYRYRLKRGAVYPVYRWYYWVADKPADYKINDSINTADDYDFSIVYGTTYLYWYSRPDKFFVQRPIHQNGSNDLYLKNLCIIKAK